MSGVVPMAKRSRRGASPYVSFALFEAYIAALANRGIPLVGSALDVAPRARSQPHLRTSLIALGLLTEQDQATPALRELVKASGTEEFAAYLAAVLRSTYPWLGTINLQHCTPSELSDRILQSGCSPGSLRKATTFFLRAAQEAGFPLGDRLKFGRRQGLPKNLARGRSAPDPAYRFALRVLERFPPFDDQWPPAVKQTWLQELGRLHHDVHALRSLEGGRSAQDKID